MDQASFKHNHIINIIILVLIIKEIFRDLVFDWRYFLYKKIV